jgi:drug/metabolite transporter (DMT)-like permease
VGGAARVERVRRLKPVDLMLLATVVLWALNLTATRYVLTHGFAPLAYSSLRYGAAGALAAAFVLARERSLRIARRDVPLLLAAAGVLWLNQLAFVYALDFTTASTTALVLGATPVFAALAALAVGVEPLTRRFAVAATASFLGVALVAAGRGGNLSGDLGGVVLALGTAASWAVYSVLLAPLMRRYSPYLVSGLVLVLCWPPLLHQDFALAPGVWGVFAYAVVGPLVITNILWFTAIGQVGPSRATLFANAQPFIAAVFALALLSERMTVLQVAGALGIGLGILLARGRRAELESEA